MDKYNYFKYLIYIIFIKMTLIKLIFNLFQLSSSYKILLFTTIPIFTTSSNFQIFDLKRQPNLNYFPHRLFYNPLFTLEYLLNSSKKFQDEVLSNTDNENSVNYVFKVVKNTISWLFPEFISYLNSKNFDLLIID